MSSSRSPGFSRSLRQMCSSLSCLGLVDVVGEIREVAAAVDHALVEEEPVEGIGNVVVMLDRSLVRAADERVAGRPDRRVARLWLPRKQQRGQVAQQLQLRKRPQPRLEAALRPQRDDVEQRAVLDVDRLRCPQLDQRIEGRAPHDPPHRLAVGDPAGPVPSPARSARRSTIPPQNAAAGRRRWFERSVRPCCELSKPAPRLLRQRGNRRHSGVKRWRRQYRAAACRRRYQAPGKVQAGRVTFWHLNIRRNVPTLHCVQQLKGGDPMSSDFVFQNVASADCTFGEQSSR